MALWQSHGTIKQRTAYYLLQLPSDKISTICILSLMKHLFKSFSEQIKIDQGILKTEDEMDQSTNVKISSISLFEIVGEAFNQEYKNLST